jgi:hypothetical protein
MVLLLALKRDLSLRINPPRQTLYANTNVQYKDVFASDLVYFTQIFIAFLLLHGFTDLYSKL